MDKDREAFDVAACARDAWNARADRFNQWDDLGGDERGEFIAMFSTGWQAALAYARQEMEAKASGVLRQAPLRAAYMVHGEFDEASFHADYDAWFVQRNGALNVSPPGKD